MSESIEVMDSQLKEEEKKCKEMLDLKITAEQQLNDFVKLDAEAKDKKKQQNREDIIKAQIQLSQLKARRARNTVEHEEIVASNEKLIKENNDYDVKNTKLNQEILELIQRIDVATLLKEVDLEEMKLLATNNINMNMAFTALLNKWDAIQKNEEDPLIS